MSRSLKINITHILLFLVIFSLERFFYLVDSSAYIIKNVFKISDLSFIFGGLFFIWVQFKCRKKAEYQHKNIIMLLFIAFIISSIIAKGLFMQPISVGIRSVRLQILSLLLYFPIKKALDNNLIEKRDLIKLIYIISTIELAIFTLQFLLANKYSFTYVDLTEIRGNSTRIRFSYLLPLIAGCLSFNKVLDKSNKKRLLHLLYVIWTAFLLIGICKHRTPSIILLLSFSCTFIMWKRSLGHKAVIAIFISLIMIPLLMNSNFVVSTIESLTNKSSRNNTLTIREEGQKYYLDRLLEKPICLLFGYGFPNENYNQAVLASGQQYYYYIVDNGLMGFIYMYGIYGGIILITLYIKNFIYSIKIVKEKSNYSYFNYSVFEIGNVYIGLHWFYYYTIPYILMLSLMDYEIGNHNKEVKEV